MKKKEEKDNDDDALARSELKLYFVTQQQQRQQREKTFNVRERRFRQTDTSSHFKDQIIGISSRDWQGWRYTGARSSKCLCMVTANALFTCTITCSLCSRPTAATTTTATATTTKHPRPNEVTRCSCELDIWIVVWSHHLRELACGGRRGLRACSCGDLWRTFEPTTTTTTTTTKADQSGH